MTKNLFLWTVVALLALTVMSGCKGNKDKQRDFDEEEMDDMDDDKIILDFITNMYNNNLYEEYEFLEEHCTKRLLRYLHEQNEYEGGGYAVWLFRTSSQDGNPDYDGGQGPASRVLIAFKSEDGWYHYQFLDGGWHGENRIKAVVRDGHVWMDQLEKVWDECADN